MSERIPAIQELAESGEKLPVAFEVIGESEITLLHALDKDRAGKPGLIHFVDMVREFGHSGSSIDDIGHGMFVLKTEGEGENLKIAGVEFIPLDERLSKKPLAAEGRYRFTGAETFIRKLAQEMYRRIEQAGSEMAKNNWLKYKDETLAALERWYPDAREGVIEFDYDHHVGGGEIKNLRYAAKSINRKGEVVNQ